MTIFDADDNFEDNDRTMTTADLVGMETADAEVKCGLVESVERCHISSVETSSSSDTTPAATEASSRSEQAGGLKRTDVHKFTSALCSAKSQSEIEKIIRECSWKSRTSEREKMSESIEVCGGGSGGGSGGVAESRQSAPDTGRSTPLDSSGSVVGNSTMTASTESYSWSSSLPNGSRLDALAANTVDDQRESNSAPAVAVTGSTGIPSRTGSTGTLSRTGSTGTPSRAGSTGIPSRAGSTGTPSGAGSTGTPSGAGSTGEGGLPDVVSVTKTVADGKRNKRESQPENHDHVGVEDAVLSVDDTGQSRGSMQTAGNRNHRTVDDGSQSRDSIQTAGNRNHRTVDDESQSRDSIQTADSINHRTVDDAGRQTAINRNHRTVDDAGRQTAINRNYRTVDDGSQSRCSIHSADSRNHRTVDDAGRQTASNRNQRTVDDGGQSRGSMETAGSRNYRIVDDAGRQTASNRNHRTVDDAGRQTAGSRNHGTVDDGGQAGVVAQPAASSRRSSCKSLRVGDFLPSHDDASETTFSSPRVSLISQLSRRRHFDESSFDQSCCDRSATAVVFSQPAASVIGRLMSTPATSASSDSGVHTSSSQSGNYLAATDQIDQRARSHSVSDHTRLDADVGSLASLRRLASTSSVVDNTLCLSTAPVEETMASSSLLPDAYHTVTEVVLPSAVMSSRIDHAVGRGDVVSFAGRIPVPLHPGSPAAQRGNRPADVALVQVM